MNNNEMNEMPLPKVRAIHLLDMARQRGVKLFIANGQLKAEPVSGPVTPAFLALLRFNTEEMMAWFSADNIAKQIQLGEFTGCNPVTARKLVRVLKNARHPFTQRAAEHLLHEA